MLQDHNNVHEKAWLMIAAVMSDRAWEFAVAVVGGYLAIKGLETKSKTESLLLLLCAVIIGFAVTPVAISYASETGIIPTATLETARPLAILLASAFSLRGLDALSMWLDKRKQSIGAK